MAKKNTRDYPKTPRFFKGGSVLDDYAERERRAGERNTRQGLAWSRERDINATGAGRPEDYERKPEEMVKKPVYEDVITGSDPESDPNFDPNLYTAKDI